MPIGEWARTTSSRNCAKNAVRDAMVCLGRPTWWPHERGGRWVAPTRPGSQVWMFQLWMPVMPANGWILTRALISGDRQSDDLGLWEVVWTLNALAPAAPLDEKMRLA